MMKNRETKRALIKKKEICLVSFNIFLLLFIILKVKLYQIENSKIKKFNDPKFFSTPEKWS